jgi:hypothetical protein
LKRTSDRLEVLSRVALTAMLLVAVPIALAFATATYAGGRSEVAAQAAERQQVTAELLADAASPAGTGDLADFARATAVWTAPSGAERTGIVPAPADTEAGSTVTVWVDQDGALTGRPISTGDAVSRATGIALVVYLGISVLAVGGHLAFCRHLDRSRARRWAAEWAEVGPVWSGMVP